MKQINHTKIRVFIHPEENSEEIKKALIFLSGLDSEKEKIEIQKTKAKGFNQKEIVILSLEIKKDRQNNAFLEFLKKNLVEAQKKELREQFNRIDDNLNFFIRLDKKELLQKKFILTDTGDCFHITLNLAVFPKNILSAHKLIKELFN